MKYLQIEKAMVAPVFDVITGLSLRSKRKQSSEEGSLYTIYWAINMTLEIGFVKDLNTRSNSTKQLGSKKICVRKGSRREEKLLKATLKELGYKPIAGDNFYGYSKCLENHLKMLGWPVSENMKDIRAR